MKKKIIEFVRHPLISGSAIIVIGSMIASVLNYIFNLEMGRSLSVSDYGTFASLVSLFNIFSVLSTTILLVFSKFAASFLGKQKEELIKPLFVKGNLWIGGLSFLVCGAIVLFSSQISQFLKIGSPLLIDITSAALFFSFISSIGMGILQGALKFFAFSFQNIFSSLIKLGLGFLFMILGFKVLGAIEAFFLASLFSYVIIFFPLYKYIKKGRLKEGHMPDLHKNLSIYGIPVFLSTLGMTAFTTIDIILIKHFFTPEVAGKYAALSLMGRSIFYVVGPVTAVLFPLIAQKKERKEKLSGTLLLSGVLIGCPSFILSLIYFIYPQLIIHIFFPAEEYKSLAPLMGIFSVFIIFYSLSFLLSNFYLSVGKTKVFLFTILGALVETIYIVFFHQNLYQIIYGLIFISFLLLFSLLIYYHNATEKA